MFHYFPFCSDFNCCLFFFQNTGVTIGFEQTLYNVTEGADPFVELCAVLTEGTLERDAIVTFFTSDGSATSACKLYYVYVVASMSYTIQCSVIVYVLSP